MERPDHPSSTALRPQKWALLIMFALLPAAASAADEPVTGQEPPAAHDWVLPSLPDLPVLWDLPEVALELQYAAPFGPGDKGGFITDMGAGVTPRLTPREAALLDLARAAVEASRAAGTLSILPVEQFPITAPAEELERLKREALAHPPVVTPTPGTGAPTDRVAAEGR